MAWFILSATCMCKPPQMGFKPNKQVADYQSVHQALLSGLLSNVAMKAEISIRLCWHPKIWNWKFFAGVRHYIKKARKWMMAAEFGRNEDNSMPRIGRSEKKYWTRVDWAHSRRFWVINANTSDPHWEKKQRQVVALKVSALYGLPIVKPAVKFTNGPWIAQFPMKIFIREALVNGDY